MEDKEKFKILIIGTPMSHEGIRANIMHHLQISEPNDIVVIDTEGGSLSATVCGESLLDIQRKREQEEFIINLKPSFELDQPFFYKREDERVARENLMKNFKKLKRKK